MDLKKINDEFYGYFNKYLVHELMWLIKNGSHNSDCFVDHKCENKLCINPDHLYLNLSSKAKVRRNKVHLNPNSIIQTIGKTKSTSAITI